MCPIAYITVNQRLNNDMTKRGKTLDKTWLIERPKATYCKTKHHKTQNIKIWHVPHTAPTNDAIVANPQRNKPDHRAQTEKLYT